MTQPAGSRPAAPLPPLARAARGSMRRHVTRLRVTLAACARRDDGAVAIIAGLTLPVFLGVAGLAMEYGHVMVVRAEAQRTADFASHAGAVAYGKTGATGDMIAAARGVARLNGFGDDEIDVQLASGASGAAVRATVTVPKPLYLPRFLGGGTSVDVVASAVASAQGGDPACIQALDAAGSGITMSGGTSLQAVECSVASNAAVEAPCGTEIIAPSLSYNAGDHPLPQWCDTITGPDGEAAKITRQSTSDPLADMAALQTATSWLADTGTLSATAGPSVATAPDIEFGWNQSNTQAQAQALGCTASKAGSTWTLSCAGQSTVAVGDITIGGGLSLRFNPAAPQSTVYNISGTIHNTGNRMTFAGGTYNVAGGIITGGGSVTEFGAGTYRIGAAPDTCDGARSSICNTSELTFDGPSSFFLSGGIRNTGGSDLTLGTGSGNSFRIGPASDGDAIAIGGGSRTVMGTTGAGDVFEIVGEVDGGGGGSCLVIPAADLHQVRGSVAASGAVRFGAGLYVVDGYMHLGGNGGGSAMCGGEMTSIRAIDTTFVIGANGTSPDGWECAGQAFCVSAGYRDIRISAPQSGPFTDLAVIGPLDGDNDAGAKFSAGASGGEVSGAFYFPNGPISMSGGASASGGSGGCLQVIGAEVTLSGGTSLASECDLPQSGGGGRVVLLR